MVTKSKTQTQKFAAKLAARNQESKINNQALVVALSGELGSGKTTFVQGFIKALGVKQHIISPTFVIMRKYQISKPSTLNPLPYKNVFHFDLYRIKKPKEILDLGFKKIITNSENIVLIEWPEKIKKLLPKNTIWITFEHGKKANERIVSVIND